MNGRFLTASQVADLLQLNVETVYRLIANDRLPATRIGRTWRFEAEQVLQWFRTRSNAAAGELERGATERAAARSPAVVRVGEEFPSHGG